MRICVGHISVARGASVKIVIEEANIKMHNQPGHLDNYERPRMDASNVDVTLTRGRDMLNPVFGQEVIIVMPDSYRRDHVTMNIVFVVLEDQSHP